MTTPHSKCVADANIWIDLHRGTLLDIAFRLPFQWLAPDLVINELEKTPSGRELVKRGLQSLELSGSEMQIVAQLSVRNRRLSIPDLSALVLAKNQGIMLLTGDGKLRRLARQEGIECHGILWILDEIVRLGILPSQQAANALQAILDAGSRLPAKEWERAGMPVQSPTRGMESVVITSALFHLGLWKNNSICKEVSFEGRVQKETGFS